MTKRHVFLLAFVVVASALLPASLSAQGLQTGNMSGTVKDQSGAVLPGVTVSVTSPALQGSRSPSPTATAL